MTLRDHLPGATSVVAATLAASCCIIPIALIALGMAGAGLMMSMMQYEWITLPLGVGGLLVGVGLYARERRRCHVEGCQLAGGRVTPALLTLATLVIMTALLLRILPGWTSRILQALVG